MKDTLKCLRRRLRKGSNMIVLVAAVIFGLLFYGIMVIGSKYESKYFNNGLCPRCNIRWYQFDMDSQGGRGYSCPRCNDSVWVSYSVDKEFLKEEHEKAVQ